MPFTTTDTGTTASLPGVSALAPPGAKRSGPIEMVGTDAGVSVIDTATPLTRVWYFDGKFLRAEHFRRDQEYTRALNALSNQATGHGVVHGFEALLGGGDSLEVAGGLAVAPSGRLILLPGAVSMSIAKLIQRSAGSSNPAVPSAPGTADFARCPPDKVPTGPEILATPRPLYLLTVAAADALCGEEERFGQLCDDACATESDRSFAVEGAVFRARRLDLSFPVLGIAVDERTTLRSRAARAYFEAERAAIASRISGAGLQTSVWCAGAAAVGGEEVALGVFDRAGTVTSWVDIWTARRELMESSPQRHWGWRLAMRPLDVFLAQVLQFQCQLIGVASGGPTFSPGDPCADERSVLAEAGEMLASLAGKAPLSGASVEGRVDRAGSPLAGVPGDIAGIGSDGHDSLGIDRITDLRRRITGALTGRVQSATGSGLLDSGFVELPSAGYLPIDPTISLVPQVSGLFGPGVDLRFCAVRPDFIPEALQEAQHMERISLTQGLVDRDMVEEVDVLVPGGTISPVTTTIDAFDGVIRILPGRKTQKGELESESATGSAITLSAVARDQNDDGWSWTLAAHGEAPHRLSVADLFGFVVGDVVGPDVEAAVEAEDAAAHAAAHAAAEAAERAASVVFLEADKTHDLDRGKAGFSQRIAREAVFARERAESVLFAPPTGEAGVKAPPDRAIPRDEKRPVALWFDLHLGRDLRELSQGDSTELRLRASVYSRARVEPVLIDAQVSGSLKVLRSELNSLGRRRYRTIVTTTDAWVDRLVISGSTVLDPPPKSAGGLELIWKIGLDDDAGRVLSVSARRGEVLASAEFSDEGTPRLIEGHVDLASFGSKTVSGGEWAMVNSYRGGRSFLRVATTELSETPGALDLGRSGRDLAENVIDVIGAELSLRGRDSGFMTAARTRMFAAPASAHGGVTATTDWVMFHRRRVKNCGTAVERPTALRTARWFHAVVDAKDDLKRFSALAGRFVAVEGAADVDEVRLRERLDGLDFELIDTLQFAEESAELASSKPALRTAFKRSDRGQEVAFGVVGSIGGGDGANVELGRLSAATGTVSDLIETSTMVTRILTEVPPEFQSPGTDTVMLTVGVRRTKTTLSTARLVRLTSEQWKTMEGALGKLADEGAAVFDGFVEEFTDGKPDEVTAQFDGAEVTNADTVLEWWNGAPALFARFGIAARHRATDDEVEMWKGERIEKVADLLAIGEVGLLDAVEWELPLHDAIVFVTPRG